MDFSRARGGKTTYPCKMVLLFEAKRQRQIFGKKKDFYSRRFILQNGVY